MRQEGADQAPASEVTVPVGIEPIPLRPAVLGPGGKRPKNRLWITGQFT
jgi:hypothetical protein